MEKNPKALWDNCLVLIRENVTEQQFNTWFAPIVFEKYYEDSRTLLLQLPSRYVFEYLEQHYVGLLSMVLNRCFGGKVQLNYRITVDQKHKLTNVEEGSEPVRIEEPQPRRQVNKSPTTLDSATPQPLDPMLDRHKTFQSFIEGDSNKLPRTVGLSIAEHPGKSTFNPFFVYGPSGCGKTHLINAIGVHCKEMYPHLRVLYVSARLFQVQFTDATRQNTVNDFIRFYQSIDVLIVDDIQEWATAVKTLDTFFHIFDHLFRLGKQIILASDRPPVDLQGVKDRLLTRFACGLIAELEHPNVQLCIDILNAKCRRDGLKIPADVIEFIAETANGSVRDLEGVVNSLLAYSVVYNSGIDMRLAERIIKRAVKVDNKPLTVDDILELIGGRDHSTVIHSCSTIEQRLKVDKSFSAELSSIENSFKLKK